MVKKAENYYAFSTPEGELIGYPSPHNQSDLRTRAQARYTGELTYVDYSRGRSSALLVFTDGVVVPRNYGGPSPRKYNFFMSTADEVIARMSYGKLRGVFVPVKKGANCAWAFDPTPCVSCNHPQQAHMVDGKCLFGATEYSPVRGDE